MTLAQEAVDDKTNEISACGDLSENLIVRGRAVTADALLTQRKIAEQIIAEGGDYVMVVKENQPQLLRDIQLLFREGGKNTDTAEQTDSGHGRIGHRLVTTSTELRDYCNWPGLVQVFEVKRRVVIKKSGEERHETVCVVSGLPSEKAGAADLLRILRGHWNIENKSHRMRDVTFDEDRSQVRCGSTPRVMAALRNTAIGGTSGH